MKRLLYTLAFAIVAVAALTMPALADVAFMPMLAVGAGVIVLAIAVVVVVIVIIIRLVTKSRRGKK